MAEGENLVVKPAAVQLGHLLVVLHLPLARLVGNQDLLLDPDGKCPSKSQKYVFRPLEVL